MRSIQMIAVSGTSWKLEINVIQSMVNQLVLIGVRQEINGITTHCQGLLAQPGYILDFQVNGIFGKINIFALDKIFIARQDPSGFQHLHGHIHDTFFWSHHDCVHHKVLQIHQHQIKGSMILFRQCQQTLGSITKIPANFGIVKMGLNGRVSKTLTNHLLIQLHTNDKFQLCFILHNFMQNHDITSSQKQDTLHFGQKHGWVMDNPFMIMRTKTGTGLQPIGQPQTRSVRAGLRIPRVLKANGLILRCIRILMQGGPRDITTIPSNGKFIIQAIVFHCGQIGNGE
mmetsp:Transcript_9597/g.19950  ORF Transcript_9597/g.19950 Transcript_9597/m.19950 type:complete len:285 (-) Transcript_9597:509-1363(-)